MWKFKFQLIPSIVTLVGLVILLGLSAWQFQRLYWKQDLIDEMSKQSKIVAIALPEQVKLPEMLYRKVIVRGKFLHQHEMHMYGGSRQFKGEPGYYIIVPMQLKNGQIILVNRGWVPEKIKAANKRPETLLEGQVEIIGSIMPTETKSRYIYDNQPARNAWFYINLAEMKVSLKLQTGDFYILASDVPNILPRGRDLEPSLRNHHLGYALTWLFSAIALLVIFLIYHRRA